jgi:hypothetical protein
MLAVVAMFVWGKLTILQLCKIINVTVVLRRMWQQYRINDDPRKLRDIHDECWYSKLSGNAAFCSYIRFVLTIFINITNSVTKIAKKVKHKFSCVQICKRFEAQESNPKDRFRQAT